MKKLVMEQIFRLARKIEEEYCDTILANIHNDDKKKDIDCIGHAGSTHDYKGDHEEKRL